MHRPLCHLANHHTDWSKTAKMAPIDSQRRPHEQRYPPVASRISPSRQMKDQRTRQGTAYVYTADNQPVEHGNSWYRKPLSWSKKRM
jgi:transposase